MQLEREIAIAPDPSTGAPRRWIFSTNNRFLRVIKETTGKVPWPIMTDPQECPVRLAYLVYALTFSYRAAVNQGLEMSFEDFEDAGFLPHYTEDEWFALHDAVNQLITDSFPKAGATRKNLQMLAAVEALKALQPRGCDETSTGTDGDTSPPKPSQDSPTESSGTVGTGSI